MNFNSVNRQDNVPLQTCDVENKVPREIALEAFKEYVEQYGNSQNFERFHQRGGFGIYEMFVFLYLRIKRLEGKSK
jgi:hypothetical protein